MDCIEVKNLLFPYQEGKLEENKRGLVESHLSECKRCAFEFNFIISIENTLRTSERIKAPEYLKGKILSNVYPLFALEKEKRELGIFSIIGAVISIIVILIFFPFETFINTIFKQPFELPSEMVLSIENTLTKFQNDTIFNIENILLKFEEAYLYLPDFSFQFVLIMFFVIVSIVFFSLEYISFQRNKLYINIRKRF